jgi:thiol:disulfide interchange protein
MNPQIEVPDSELQGLDDDFGPSGGSMKPVLIVIGLVAAIGLGLAGFRAIQAAHGGEWLHSLDEGLKAADRSGKPVLALFTADWCPPCRQLKKDVFGDPEVMTYLETEFVLVKIDLTDRRGENNWVAADAGVKYIPTIIFYEDGYEMERFGASEFTRWVYQQ